MINVICPVPSCILGPSVTAVGGAWKWQREKLHERDHSGRRQRNAALARYHIGFEATAAHARQTDDLLSTGHADAGGYHCRTKALG